jgi:hypothetical protein
MATTVKKRTTVALEKDNSKRISKAGLFMRSLPKGEILDMRAVLK